MHNSIFLAKIARNLLLIVCVLVPNFYSLKHNHGKKKESQDKSGLEERIDYQINTFIQEGYKYQKPYTLDRFKETPYTLQMINTIKKQCPHQIDTCNKDQECYVINSDFFNCLIQNYNTDYGYITQSCGLIAKSYYEFQDLSVWSQTLDCYNSIYSNNWKTKYVLKCFGYFSFLSIVIAITINMRSDEKTTYYPYLESQDLGDGITEIRNNNEQNQSSSDESPGFCSGFNTSLIIQPSSQKKKFSVDKFAVGYQDVGDFNISNSKGNSDCKYQLKNENDYIKQDFDMKHIMYKQ